MPRGPNRREWLTTVAAAPLALATAARSQTAEDELIVCGWDEVFVLAVAGEAPTHRKVWSWRAVESDGLPADMHPLFRTTDDCKPVDGGRILISSSGGAIALVERATARTLFHARVTNAHSIEMLPGGRVAAAASTSNAGTGNRLIIFDLASGQPVATDDLYSAHGLVWDGPRDLLWALGGEVLRGYTLRTTSAGISLERAFELRLPSAGGHELSAITGSPRLFASTVRHAWYFDRDRRELIPHDTLADQANIKSYNVHPRTGRVVYVQQEGTDWWAEHLHFRKPDGAIRLPGEHLYKARWA